MATRARPVRVGNGAFDQRQNDVYGVVLDSIHLHTVRSQRMPTGLWPIVQAQAACATAAWGQPDQGIWEAWGKPQHYVSSKLMGWVARIVAKLAELRGAGDLRDGWRATAEEIRADILAHGVSAQGVLRQHYDTDALDASTLLAPMFGFLSGDDERACNTVLTIAEDLTENGYVLRYRTDETDDGMSGKEGTFLICSFWLVSALSIVGESARACDLMERCSRRLTAWAVRRGVRRRHWLPPRELSAGVFPPRPDRGGGPDHRRRTIGRASRVLTLHGCFVILRHGLRLVAIEI